MEQITNNTDQWTKCEMLLHCALCTVLFALCSLLFAMPLQAKITGNCSNCHTMHNSQDGQPMQILSPVETETGAKDLLLRSTCLGCHGKGASNNREEISGNVIPQVLHINVADLAGGNFAYVTGMKARASSDTNTAGHNVTDLGFNDTVLTSPPGDQHSTNITNSNFTCSGVKGCHGDRTIEGKFSAIRGSHHSDTQVLAFGSIDENAQGSSTATSYRYLKGVKGGEDSDWQATVNITDHNEYKGALSMDTSSSTEPAGNTISGFCAECHGYFHGGASDEAGASSPWFRHPTDISLPSSAEFSSYTTYNLTVPVARTSIPNNPSSIVTPSGTGDDIVMCLTCHYAHASPYYKLLRWDYKNSSLSGALSGCLVCHTSKS